MRDRGQLAVLLAVIGLFADLISIGTFVFAIQGGLSTSSISLSAIILVGIFYSAIVLVYAIASAGQAKYGYETEKINALFLMLFVVSLVMWVPMFSLWCIVNFEHLLFFPDWRGQNETIYALLIIGNIGGAILVWLSSVVVILIIRR